MLLCAEKRPLYRCADAQIYSYSACVQGFGVMHVLVNTNENNAMMNGGR